MCSIIYCTVSHFYSMMLIFLILMVLLYYDFYWLIKKNSICDALNFAIYINQKIEILGVYFCFVFFNFFPVSAGTSA